MKDLGRITGIHIVEKLNNIRAVDASTDEYESSWWALSAGQAKDLVGGDVYFHRSRAQPSFFGGRILGYRVEAEGEYAGRFVLRLRSDVDHKGVTTSREGWSMEKKIVR